LGRPQPIILADRRSRLAEWFRDLRGPLRRFIAGRRDAAQLDADDVAQEVFLRLLRYADGEVISDPRAYLFKIASNVASEWSMRASNRLPHESSWLEELADDSNIHKEIERTERNSKLYDALSELPPRAREILRLHFGEGLAHGAISTRLGVTQRVVKRDTLRAYATLRFILAPQRDDIAIVEMEVEGAMSSEA
jgi:RNA polymerase sigma factor (sigma-70 family)